MKKTILTAISFTTLLSTGAYANPYKYVCTTDTNKAVELEYSYNNGYSMNRLMIDGQNFRGSAQMSVTRSGIQVRVLNFRAGEELNMTLLGMNGSTYKVGSGSLRAMNCEDKTQKATRNDGI